MKDFNEKLKGRFYGLLCEREKADGEWEKYIETIQLELLGIEQENSIEFNSLMAKIGILKMLNFEYFRKTIFECMNLIDRIDFERGD